MLFGSQKRNAARSARAQAAGAGEAAVQQAQQHGGDEEDSSSDGDNSSAAVSPKITTSIQILGLSPSAAPAMKQNDSSSSCKKRELKEQEKQERMEKESAKSEVSNITKRSNNGRFEGGSAFNGKLFVKAGIKKNKQVWQCSCKVTTVDPLKHNCKN
jgi:hypothetical protein